MLYRIERNYLRRIICIERDMLEAEQITTTTLFPMKLYVHYRNRLRNFFFFNYECHVENTDGVNAKFIENKYFKIESNYHTQKQANGILFNC